MKYHLKLRTCLIIILLIISSLSIGYSQNTFQTFGKNRVQHKKFYWRFLSTANFDIYYYDSGARLANFATRYLETEFDEITDILGYTPYYKSRIFIYNSISDLQQSNVGIEANSIVVGGQTDFFKSQVEIPYTGNEVDFKKELRRGIAQMLVREMMFGGSLKEMLQSSYLGKFSEWFLVGASSYVAEGWSEEMDDHLRDLFNSRRTKKPNLMSGKDAVLVGQSIWNYISEKHGTTSISSILNLARIIRNERNSIGSALGIKYSTFLEDWKNYYKLTTNEIKENTTDPEMDFRLRKRNRKNLVFNEFKVNPEGSKIAYSENKNGKFRVIVQDLRTRKRKVLLKKGYNAINQRYDENIPLLSWRDNRNLGVMTVRKGEAKLTVYNPRGKQSYERTWFYFNHVSSFDFSDDGNNLILSADRKGEIDFKTGQNDLFIFNLETNNLEQMTDDWFDDLDPMFLPNSNFSFMFSSNRTNDTLSTNLIKDRGNYNEDLNNFDIFIYDPGVSKTRVNRLTYTPDVDSKPRLLDAENVLYLSDENGSLQLKKVNLKNLESTTLTNYNQSLRTYEPNPVENGLAYLMIKKGRVYPNYKRNFNFGNTIGGNYKTPRMRVLAKKTKNDPIIIPEKRVPTNFTDSAKVEPIKGEIYADDEVDTDNYKFDDDVVKDKQSPLEKTQDEMLKKIKKLTDDEIKVRGPYDYVPRFRNENFVTSVQMDPLRNTGFLLNMSTSDLLENHKIKGGLLQFADLKNSDFYGEYQYLARRFDFGLRYDRKRYFFSNDFTQKHTLNKWQATLSYPITNLSRVSISPFYMNTAHTVTGASNLYPVRDNKYHYAGVKLEYVFDNTVINGQNMIAGTRMKVVYEDYRGITFSRHITDAFNAVGASIKPRDINFAKITADIRHYYRIHKDLIFAVRVSYGRFLGRSPKTFLLGGMDNMLFGRQLESQDALNTSASNFSGISFNNQRVAFANEDIIFTEFVTNLRGFNYAKVAGENYLVSNLELRFPIIKYLFGKRINSNFLNNLQLAGFFDIGTAWTGVSPFNQKNSLNTRIVGGGDSPFTAVVNDFKNPWLAGYGAGLRTVMLGYYLKFDLAWAVEDYIIASKPKLYVTFGYDF